MVKIKIKRKLQLVKSVLEKNTFPINSNRKNIFFLNIPTYGNLGDQAIIQSTLAYFKLFFPEYDIHTVYLENLYKNIEFIKSICTPDDIVFLHGGGNVGNLYCMEEEARRLVIKKIKNCKIISMPQSVYFTKDFQGERELKKSISIYNSNNNFIFFARDKYSYSFMKNNFKCKALLVPDIVFFLAKSIHTEDSVERSNITVCLRSDKESNLKMSIRNQLLAELQSEFKNSLFLYDTVVSRSVYNSTRKFEICSILNEFSRSKLIITDRLHGMIFSAITGTPCIVIKSLDTKILGAYDWIKHLKYIKLLNEESTTSIVKASKDLLENSNNFNNNFIERFDFEKFDLIKKAASLE